MCTMLLEVAILGPLWRRGSESLRNQPCLTSRKHGSWHKTRGFRLLVSLFLSVAPLIHCYPGRKIGAKKDPVWIHNLLLYINLNFFYAQPELFIFNLSPPHSMTLQCPAASGVLGQWEGTTGNALFGLRDHSREAELERERECQLRPLSLASKIHGRRGNYCGDFGTC